MRGCRLQGLFFKVFLAPPELHAPAENPGSCLQVMWLQGIIIAVVILIALTVGCCCMHLVDVPTRFAQGEARREHAD